MKAAHCHCSWLMAFYNDIYSGGAHSSDHMLWCDGNASVASAAKKLLDSSLRLVCAGYTSSSELNHARGPLDLCFGERSLERSLRTLYLVRASGSGEAG